jgi:hypothetical protein
MKTEKPSSENKRSWRRLFGAPLLVAAVLALALPAQAGEPGVGGKRGVDVMQVNLFIGAGIDRVMALDPTDPAYRYNLALTVTGIYYEIAASQPDVRLQGVAQQIAGRMPDLVSVEEASLIRIQSPGDLAIGGTNLATEVVYDYLQILTNALAAQGAHYAIVSTAAEIDIEMPMFNQEGTGLNDVRWTDREAILVRSDLPPGQLRVANPQSGNFAYCIQIPGTGITVTRGWCSVDAFIRGRNIRYICPHLEQETVPVIQYLQALELLAGPANTQLPVIIAGDFNSDLFDRDGSGALAYSTMVAGGFQDAWAVVHPGNPAGGLTWGHDEFLASPAKPFDRRIDFVFYRGAGLVPQSADVLDLWLGRSAAPLWSSDHAAVNTGFQIK